MDISPFVVKIDISIEPLNIQDHEVRCRNGHKIAIHIFLLPLYLNNYLVLRGKTRNCSIKTTLVWTKPGRRARK